MTPTPIDPGREVRTTCPYCGVGCGVIARAEADGSVAVRGDPDHPANFGRLCSKGSALGETVGLAGRLLHPEVDGRQVGWDEALDTVAARFSATVAEHGPEAVAFYVSGQLLTEDYYLANKLMKGFIGAANIDTNSRLCMASAVAGHRRAFGADTVPVCYEDLEQADLVVLVGSNFAWCHPVLHQRLLAARAERPSMRIVVIDPRRTATAEAADLHLAIRPDGDAALFVHLLARLAADGRIDRTFVESHTTGLEDALAAARALGDVTAGTGLSAADIAAFCALFSATERVVTVFSQGVNQASVGTDKVNAILNVHLATGRIGRPGTGPFSITGQPNAMGGREVGGLANMLAAHMDIEDPAARERVGRFWKAPAVADRPGLKAVDLFRAVADGRIKALWIMATNPVDSLPDADAVEAAIRACPFVVVSDVSARTDTVRHAHVRLPAAAWGEKDGTVTNSERRISRQRPFLALPGAARPDWWIIAEVARRMGHAEAFAYDGPARIFAEHAALSTLENDDTRDFDLGGLVLDAEAYEALAPVQWPIQDGETDGRRRFFADGRFYTPDRRARFVAVAPVALARATPDHPFLLNTGRVRDHWHTMTRTGTSPRLSGHIAEPFAELHPRDAARLGIRDAEIVEVSSAHGSVLVRALLTPRQAEGAVFVPMHWTDQDAARARVDALVPPLTDPVSGQPALKHAAVSVRRFEVAIYGFAVLAERPAVVDAGYWAMAVCTGGYRLEFARATAPAEPLAFAAELIARPAAELSIYSDRVTGAVRMAAFEGDRLVGALHLATEPVSVSRSWAVGQLTTLHPTARDRMRVLAGRPAALDRDPGAIVCGCHAVGVNDLGAAIASGACTLAAVGQATRAGTNCGSCRSEIETLLRRAVVAAE